MGFLTKLFKPKTPTIVMPDPTPVATPEVAPAAVMPDTDSAEVKRAKTAEMRRQMQRNGRQSTIMSQANSNAGTDSYSSSKLG